MTPVPGYLAKLHANCKQRSLMVIQFDYGTTPAQPWTLTNSRDCGQTPGLEIRRIPSLKLKPVKEFEQNSLRDFTASSFQLGELRQSEIRIQSVFDWVELTCFRHVWLCLIRWLDFVLFYYRLFQGHAQCVIRFSIQIKGAYTVTLTEKRARAVFE